MTEKGKANPFDTKAAAYDAWFDSPEGRLIFTQESACLEELIGGVEGRWLEVGVGTGRFAHALGVTEGVDPSSAVLEMASRRGIRTRVGCGEDLPYADGVFDGVLMVVTVCFLADAAKTLEECSRVLEPGGRVVVGLVPADSPWGELYARKGREGHPFYSAAGFYTCDEVVALAVRAGLAFGLARSCLFTPPGEPLTAGPPREGIVPNAGFVALEFVISRNDGS